MDIVYRIKQEIKAQNTTIAAVERALGLGNGTISKWDKQSPSCNNMLKLANYLNCTVDYLLTGIEKSSPAEQLTADEQELLTYYRQLNDKSQGILLGRAEAMAENQQNIDTNMSANKPYIAKTIVYSRSTNNMPSRVETGDLSDIINAPDSTDEY